MNELRRLNLASGPELETRARCQDDGHPPGCVHPWWFGGQPGTFCHCGRVVHRGVLPVVSWRLPTTRELAWAQRDAERKAATGRSTPKAYSSSPHPTSERNPVVR